MNNPEIGGKYAVIIRDEHRVVTARLAGFVCLFRNHEDAVIVAEYLKASEYKEDRFSAEVTQMNPGATVDFDCWVMTRDMYFGLAAEQVKVFSRYRGDAQ